MMQAFKRSAVLFYALDVICQLVERHVGFLVITPIWAVPGVIATLGQVYLVSKTTLDLTGAIGMSVITKNIGQLLKVFLNVALKLQEVIKRVNWGVDTLVFYSLYSVIHQSSTSTYSRPHLHLKSTIKMTRKIRGRALRYPTV